jgi:hypothetical protein
LQVREVVMRILFTFLCVLGLGVVGCSETADTGGSVTENIEEMLVGRWWLDWDEAGGLTTGGGIGLATFAADGWANYDVEFPSIPGLTDWCRRYADWSLFDVVSQTEFGYALTYTEDSCNRAVGWIEEFKVVLDQTNPPKGQVTRLSSSNPGVEGEYTMPIERCTTDINASEACTFDTGLGAPSQNPAP